MLFLAQDILYEANTFSTINLKRKKKGRAVGEDEEEQDYNDGGDEDYVTVVIL